MAGNDADCKASVACEKWGTCHFEAKGELSQSCIAKSDADCTDTQICKLYGKCTVNSGKCQAMRRSDCQNATVACKRRGMCRPEDGKCVR